MSLERVQASTNRQRVGAGNLSASNDPSQWEHDGRELLIKGAELAGAGRALGLSEEETLAAVSRQYRRQRRADDSVTPSDVLRQMTQSLATTSEDVGSAEIKGVGYQDTSEIDDAFGVTDYEGGLRDLDADNGVDSRGPEPENKGTRRFPDGSKEIIRNPVRPQEEEFYKPDVAPKSAMSDALSAVKKEQASREGLVSKVSRVFGGPSERDIDLDTASEALKRHLEPEAPQDARIGRATVRQDRQRFNPEVEEANYYKAETDALAERRRLYGPGGYGYRGDVNLQRTRPQPETHAEWLPGGYAEKVFGPSLGIETEIARRSDGVYLDPVSGDPVAVQGPESPHSPYAQDGGSANTSSDGLNAPQTARQWLAQGLGERMDSMRGSDQIPQIDITTATSTAANRVRDYYKKIGVTPTVRVPENIRSVDELQRVVDRVLKATGGQLTVPDFEKGGGAQKSAQGREVEGALIEMAFTGKERNQLSQALYQLDAAKRSSVNENPTGVYLSRTGEPTKDVTFDSGDVIDEGMMKAKIASIPRGSTIRVAVEGKDKPQRRNIVDQLRQLPTPAAASATFGQVEGEQPRINRYTRSGQSDGVDSAIAVRKQAEKRAKGKEVDAGRTRANQVRTMLIKERENRDNARRADQASELIAQLPPNARRTRLRGR